MTLLTTLRQSDKIYSIKREGERTYYVSFNGEEEELSQLLKREKLNNVNENGELLTEITNSPVEENLDTEKPTEEVIPETKVE